MVCYLRKDLFLCWLHLFFLLWIFLRYFSGFFMAFPRLRRVITKLKAINRVICVVLTSQKSWVIEMYVLEKRSWLQVHWTKESGVKAVDELGIMDILVFLCRLKLGLRARVWNNKSSHTFSCSLSFYTHPSFERENSGHFEKNGTYTQPPAYPCSESAAWSTDNDFCNCIDYWPNFIFTES